MMGLDDLLIFPNIDGFAKSRNFSIFVIPAPYQIRGKLQGESSKFKEIWTPASAGVTVLGLFTR